MSTNSKVYQNPKRIIVCCDGTACTTYKGNEASPLTNVSRISRCIKPATEAGTPQIVLHLPGVGTAAGNPFNTINQGLGIGIDEKIMEAYSFICHNYEREQDQIILVGFSRGAFTVRCVADLIQQAGLLTKVGLYYLRQLYDYWSDGKLSVAGDSQDYIGHDQNYDNYQNTKMDLKTFHHQVLSNPELRRFNIRIKVCAVWDTVSSLGVPRLGFFGQRPSTKLRSVHSNLCDGIEHAFQALSLHEHRQPFLPVVWRPRPGKTRPIKRLKQCWFMGYHADIGGGNRDESLAHFPLAWMIVNLAPFVEFDLSNFWRPRPQMSSWRVSENFNENPFFTVTARVSDPMNMFYWLGGSIDRKPCRHFWSDEGFVQVDPPVGNSNERIHRSVRLLTKLRAFPACPSLRGIEPQEDHNGWGWNLQLNAGHASTYRVLEDGLDEDEIRLLEIWLNSELEVLQDNAGEADPVPNTVIAQLRHWLSMQV